MHDTTFKEQLGATPMSRSGLRHWKREYSKRERSETPAEFHKRVASAVRKTSPTASSRTSGHSGVR